MGADRVEKEAVLDQKEFRRTVARASTRSRCVASPRRGFVTDSKATSHDQLLSTAASLLRYFEWHGQSNGALGSRERQRGEEIRDRSERDLGTAGSPSGEQWEMALKQNSRRFTVLQKGLCRIPGSPGWWTNAAQLR